MSRKSASSAGLVSSPGDMSDPLWTEVLISHLAISYSISASGKNRPLIRDYQTIPNADNIQVRIPSQCFLPFLKSLLPFPHKRLLTGFLRTP